ncbi:MAG: hypothetical protein ACKV2T_35320 [Kofleriaceae bacterium]
MRGIAVVLVCASCAAEDDRVVGVVEFGSEGLRVDAPAMASPGEPFAVAVTTYGSSCVSVHSTEIEYAGDSIVITPYDRERGNNCHLILLFLEHRVELTFPDPGTKTVTIRGRKVELVARERISDVSHDIDIVVE